MYSFDVFDTLITRKLKNPQGIFSVMGYKLVRDCKYWDMPVCYMADFEIIRINAENQARSLSKGEVTLDFIYHVLAHNYGLSEEISDRLKQLEIQCEIENCVAIKENIEKIRDLLQHGEKVILISDMYLPKGIFERLFEKVAPILNCLPLYVSSEIGLTKASGLLYEYVRNCEGINYEEWIHIGDNIVSDVNIPEAFGIKTVYYKIETDLICAHRLEQINIKNTIIKEYLLGLLKEDKLKGKSREYLIGYSFIGIVLYAYVDWVIRQAQNMGITHLFFIARDGYILKDIAEDITKSSRIKIKIHYIYGSRKVWRVTEKNAQRLLLRYMEQQLNIVGEMAFVDTQGTGISIDSLGKLCVRKFKVFYYTLLESIGNKNIEVYSYSSYSGKGIIEAFCRAPHGPTICYEVADGIVRPVLAEINREIWDKSGLDEYIKGVKAFSRFFSEIDALIDEQMPLDSVADTILHYCAETPDLELANFIGDIPHDTDNENKNYVYAPKLSMDEIYKIEFVRTIQGLEQFYHGIQLQYSYKRLNVDEQKMLEKFQSEYYEKSEKKDNNAVKIIIYGFGLYGKELFHRSYRAANVEVKGIVDANYQKYEKEKIHVSSIKNIKQLEFDYIVISLSSSKSAEEVRNMLMALGIPENKIMLRESFVSKYLEEKLPK